MTTEIVGTNSAISRATSHKLLEASTSFDA